MPLKIPRWDEITHSSISAYRFRQKYVMGPIKWLAAQTPWFNKSIFLQYNIQQNRILSEYLKGASVLEVGCGPGSFGDDVIKRFGANIYDGMDISFGMVKGASRIYPQYNFLAASAESLPFCDNAYDVVIACYTFHHLPLSIRVPSFSELLRVAKQKVIIIDAYGFPKSFIGLFYKLYYRLADGSYYRYTLDEWESFFSLNNVRIIDSTHNGNETIVYRVGCWVLQHS